MPDDNGNTTALAPIQGIGDDQLLAVAEAAEKRIAAVNRIKGLALRVTNHQDWTDQGGKPYLQVSGSEKVARLFGISWRLDEPTREEHSDGHFSYTFKGYFSMGTAEIEVVGTRSSSDPFFGGGKHNRKPVSEIDRNDVKKGAMTNCIGNGISRLLGIRNLTWDEVKSGGVQQSQVSKVEYKTEKPQQDATMVQPATDKYTGEPIRQEDGAETHGILGEHVGSPQQASDAPAPSTASLIQTADALARKSAAEIFALDMAAQAEKNEHSAEGYIGNHTPRLAGKQAPPGRFTLDTLHGELTLQYWDRPEGLGQPNHSYAKVTYRQSERTGKGGKTFTNNELLSLHWAAPKQ